MSRRQLPLLLAALLLCASPARAEDLPSQPVRALLVQADTVVLAVPSVGGPDRFRVTRRLLGAAVEVGQDIQASGSATLATDPNGRPGPSGHPQVQQALLFLGRSPGGVVVIPTGVRAVTAQGQVFWPQQLSNPGPYQLVKCDGVDWNSLVGRTAADCAAVAALRRARELSAGPRRTEAVQSWLERHGPEFTSFLPLALRPHPADQQYGAGWYGYEREPFRWLLEGAGPEQAWQAVRLHARVHHGELPPDASAAFASPAGREFLRRVLADPARLEGDCTRAVRLLSQPGTLLGGDQPITPAERVKLLKDLSGLLASASPLVRRRAAEALTAVSQLVGETGEFDRTALPALEKAYEAAAPGETRNALAEAVRVLGGGKRWRERTGQAGGLAAYLRDLGGRDGKLTFALELRPAHRVHEAPALQLERLDAVGKVAERKTLPLAAEPAPAWTEGWDTSSLLPAELVVKDLQPGTWVVRATGTVGQDKQQKWTSEPRRFRVVAVRNPGPGRPPKVAVLEKDDRE
jgi:hypothetical protein